jgi:hypothetical protein
MCGAATGKCCASGLCCSSNGYCGSEAPWCGAGCQSAFGTCWGSTPPPSPARPTPAVPSPVPSGPSPSQPSTPSPAGAGPDETFAGISKSQFTAVFAGDVDKCSNCPDAGAKPNTQAVIDKHWGFFKSAATAMGLSFATVDEAAMFFGNVRHEYGGQLETMAEFCGRRDPSGQACLRETGQTYGRYFGRGPKQLSHDYNYQAMGAIVGADLLSSPDLLADPTRDLGWRSTIAYYLKPDFNCAGTWGELAALPTCQQAGRANNAAAFTRRINSIECGSSAPGSNQYGRVQVINTVRQKWGLAPLTANLYC